VNHRGYVVMAQIDAARRVATSAVQTYQTALHTGGSWARTSAFGSAVDQREALRADRDFKREIVDTLLSKWWAQGCKEVR
jgi:hypothetical protein